LLGKTIEIEGRRHHSPFENLRERAIPVSEALNPVPEAPEPVL